MKDLKLDNFAQEVASFLPGMMRVFTKTRKNDLTKGIISLPQLSILEYLSTCDKCIMSDVAKLLSVSMSAVTGLTDRMIKNKLITRTRCEKDRRVVFIAIRSFSQKRPKGIRKKKLPCKLDLDTN